MNNKQTLFEKLISKKSLEIEANASIRHSFWFKIVIIISTIAICSFFFIFHIKHNIEEPDKFNLVPGYTWTSEKLQAEYTFPIYKSNQEYQAELRIARESTSPVFLLDQSKEAILLEKVNSLLDSLQNITAESNKLLDEPLSDRAIKPFLQLNQNQRINKIRKLKRELNKFINDVYRNGFVNVNLERIEHNEVIVRIPPNREYPLQKSGLTDRGLYLDNIRAFASKEFEKSVDLVIEILSKDAQPNLSFSEELTEQARQVAEKSVPKTSGLIRKGEVIVNQGEILTDEVIPIIKSYHTSRQMRRYDAISFTAALGSIGHSMIIYSIVILYLIYIRKKIFNDNFQLAVISSLLVFVSAMAWASVELQFIEPIEYLIFLPALSMLAAIIFDSRTAFYVTVAMALMIAGIRGNDYSTGTAMLFAGTLAAYTVRDIQSRTQIFRSMFSIFIGLSIAIIVFGLERSLEFDVILSRLVFSLFNAALAPVITFGALFILERISNIATDLRIKEYDNLNHPLLVKMNETAPGTYQHTLAVALLGERCAQAIGANPLLTKVGAYFHDIGKMAKAEYFTENQLDIGNKHDLIQPIRSAAAIREHVLDGIELAKQYKLPKRIIDFIPMHHGTSLIRHFYAKALEEAEAKGVKVNENDFKYPGPLPNSKETAILMICDAAEAISRITDMDKDAIKQKIANTINDKILEGQFDNSNLTFEEVNIIKDTIFKYITAKTHQRVNYKEIPKLDDK